MPNAACPGLYRKPLDSAIALQIAPVAARVTGKQMTMKKYTYFAGRLDGHDDALVHYIVCFAQWRRTRASLEAAGYHHWASINYDNIKGTYYCRFFVVFFIINTVEMGAKQKDGP